jgi:hypothetical protein
MNTFWTLNKLRHWTVRVVSVVGINNGWRISGHVWLFHCLCEIITLLNVVPIMLIQVVARGLYLSYNPLNSAEDTSPIDISSGSRTRFLASFSGPGRGAGSTAHALPSVFSDRSYECTQNGGHDFARTFRSETSSGHAVPTAAVQSQGVKIGSYVCVYVRMGSLQHLMCYCLQFIERVVSCQYSTFVTFTECLLVHNEWMNAW